MRLGCVDMGGTYFFSPRRLMIYEDTADRVS